MLKINRGLHHQIVPRHDWQQDISNIRELNHLFQGMQDWRRKNRYGFWESVQKPVFGKCEGCRKHKDTIAFRSEAVWVKLLLQDARGYMSKGAIYVVIWMGRIGRRWWFYCMSLIDFSMKIERLNEDSADAGRNFNGMMSHTWRNIPGVTFWKRPAYNILPQFPWSAT